jgi:D-alanyl-D-alanine carboxypeptidase/D-alanyl-D-alanine-endopeptidase (penicillin-binding protein 4)
MAMLERPQGVAALTYFCRSILIALFIIATPARAFDSRQLWSNEFGFHETPELESTIPLTFGIAWAGNRPRVENEDRLFSLASVKKVITAATALRVLGPDFRFANEFTGEFDPLQKAIYRPTFSVSGDPTWGHEAYGESLRTRVAKVVAELKKQNVKKVVGEIQFNLLKSELGNYARPSGWKPQWKTACYAGLTTPVILNGNCAQMAVYPNGKVFWITQGVDTPITNRLVRGSVDQFSVMPVLDQLGRVERYEVSGSVTRAGSVFLPVHSNEDWLRNLLISELRANGIEYFIEPSRWARHGAMTNFYVDLSSKDLKEMLIPFLQNSINIVGDRLHIEASSDLETFASLMGAETDFSRVSLVDGSGLMAANQVTPRLFLQFLNALKNQPYFDQLYAGLPVSGVSGTLQSRMGTSLLKNRVHAKTGTIDRVVNLGGFWFKQNQELEPFVIFTESSLTAADAREKVDAIVDDFARNN